MIKQSSHHKKYHHLNRNKNTTSYLGKEYINKRNEYKERKKEEKKKQGR